MQPQILEKVWHKCFKINYCVVCYRIFVFVFKVFENINKICVKFVVYMKTLKTKTTTKISQKSENEYKNQPIIDLPKNGTMPKGSAKMLKKPLSTIYTVISCFQMTGCVKGSLTMI